MDVVHQAFGKGNLLSNHIHGTPIRHVGDEIEGAATRLVLLGLVLVYDLLPVRKERQSTQFSGGY